MRRIILTICLLCVCAVASATATYRFKGGVVTVGDSVPSVMQRAGQPDRIVTLQNDFGAAVGERWEYYVGNKMVSIVFSGGRVIAIDEVR